MSKEVLHIPGWDEIPIADSARAALDAQAQMTDEQAEVEINKAINELGAEQHDE